MTDTPIIDAAIRAGCGMGDECLWPSDGCNENGCALGTAALVMDALRAALPWEPSPETTKAMAWGMCQEVAIRSRKELLGSFNLAISAYRAQPIMRELYPEKFA